MVAEESDMKKLDELDEHDVSDVSVEPHDAQLDVVVFQDTAQLVKGNGSKTCKIILSKIILYDKDHTHH